MQIDNDNKRERKKRGKEQTRKMRLPVCVANNIPDKKRAVELVRLNEIVDKLERPKTQRKQKKSAENISALIEHSQLPVCLRF